MESRLQSFQEQYDFFDKDIGHNENILKEVRSEWESFKKGFSKGLNDLAKCMAANDKTYVSYTSIYRNCSKF